MKEKKRKKYWWSAFLTVLLLIVTLPILFFNSVIIYKANTEPSQVPAFYGYKPFIVLSGSMVDTINIGDLVWVKTIPVTEVAQLQVGDVIAFREGNMVVTHRIVAKDLNEYGQWSFTTKGDHNNANDLQPVLPSQLEGKFVARWAKIGNVLLFIQKPFGFAIILTGLFVLATFMLTSSNKNSHVSRQQELEAEIAQLKKEKEALEKDHN